MLTATLTTLAPAMVATWYAAPMVARRVHERRLRALCASRGRLVLTYDDGPSSFTARLLDLLRSRDARATFFLVGERAQEQPALVDRIATDGHEIACHTHAHLNAWYSSPWKSVADVNTGYCSLARWVRGNGLFRPPHGKMTVATWAAVHRRRAPIGWWTIDAGDADDKMPGPEDAADRARRAGGGVVLLHDSDREAERDEFTLESTRLLLDAARERNWAVATLGELLGQA